LVVVVAVAGLANVPLAVFHAVGVEEVARAF
jgi:hypothetical protein